MFQFFRPHINIFSDDIYLAAAVVIFSTSNTFFTFLHHRNKLVFTPCNVLCASNMMGLMITSLWYWRDIKLEDIKRLTRKDLMFLTLGSVLYSVIGPLFFMSGLASTDVSTAAVLQRLESVNLVLFSIRKVSNWSILNSLCTVVGVLVAILTPPLFDDPINFTIRGDLLIILSGYAFTGSILISSIHLAGIPIPLLLLFRSSLGTVMYHYLQYLEGAPPDRFYNVDLWMWMVPYGLLYAFLGQYLFQRAVRLSSTLRISVGTNLLFFLNLTWSTLLLNSPPSKPQLFGSVFIVLSIISHVTEQFYNANARVPSSSSSTITTTTAEYAAPPLQKHLEMNGCSDLNELQLQVSSSEHEHGHLHVSMELRRDIEGSSGLSGSAGPDSDGLDQSQSDIMLKSTSTHSSPPPLLMTATRRLSATQSLNINSHSNSNGNGNGNGNGNNSDDSNSSSNGSSNGNNNNNNNNNGNTDMHGDSDSDREDAPLKSFPSSSSCDNFYKSCGPNPNRADSDYGELEILLPGSYRGW